MSREAIYDVDTAIEVCRQQGSTLDDAVKLAKQKKRWKLLVHIYMDSKDRKGSRGNEEE